MRLLLPDDQPANSSVSESRQNTLLHELLLNNSHWLEVPCLIINARLWRFLTILRSDRSASRRLTVLREVPLDHQVGE